MLRLGFSGRRVAPWWRCDSPSRDRTVWLVLPGHDVVIVALLAVAYRLSWLQLAVIAVSFVMALALVIDAAVLLHASL